VYKVVVREKALYMAREAYWWYELQSPGLGERFMEEIDDCLAKLKTNPNLCSLTEGNHRQIIVKHFPYKIIYNIHEMEVFITAVFHTSQNPERMFE
jgi:plasmid stabilization system protein ParE